MSAKCSKRTIEKRKKLRNGSVLIEVENEQQSRKDLQNLNLIAGQIPIIVFPHKSLNSGRGVIRCWHLDGMSTDDIRDALNSQGVI